MEEFTGESNNQDISPNIGSEERIAGASGRMNRREFLEKVAFVSLSALLAGCMGRNEEPNEVPTSFREDNTPTSENTPTATNTSTPSPTATTTNTVTPTPTNTQTATPTPTETAAKTRIPTNENPMIKGFYTQDVICGEKADQTCTRLGAEFSKINGYEVNGDEISFDVTMLIYGVEISTTVTTESFELIRYNRPAHSMLSREIVTSDYDFSRFEDTNLDYQLGLFVKGHQYFTEELFQDYINGDIELEFILHDLMEFVA